MLKIRILIPGVLAVLAVSDLASTPASAAECTKESGTHKFVLCLGEPLVLTPGTFTTHIETDGAAGYILNTTTLTISCPAVTGSASVDSGQGNVTVLNMKLSSSGCGVTGAPGCKLVEPITTTSLSGVEDPPAKEKEKVLFLPTGGGSEIATITYQNKTGEECLIDGSYKVFVGPSDGGVLCTSPAETTRLSQLLTCLAANSKVEFIRQAADVEGHLNVRLFNKGIETKWAIIEGL